MGKTHLYSHNFISIGQSASKPLSTARYTGKVQRLNGNGLIDLSICLSYSLVPTVM